MMNKMNYENLVCQINFAENFKFEPKAVCDYCDEAAKYAVARTFTKSQAISKLCTNMSWRIRLAKGKQRKHRYFAFRIPAGIMELPGSMALVKGYVDEVGAVISYVELSA